MSLKVRAGQRLANPVRSEGSSRNEPRFGRCQPLTYPSYFFRARHFVAEFLGMLPAARVLAGGHGVGLVSSSATSLRQRGRRAGSIFAVAMAACTAQPGSTSCWQSRKRQLAEGRFRSGNRMSMPSATSVSCNSRTPGVSISQPPCGSGRRLRAVVVWRPLASSSRMPPTA